MIFDYPPMERVHIGTAFESAVLAEADRIGARRVFLMIGGTLSRGTDFAARLAAALGERLVGSWSRMGAHTPRTDVVAAANAARERGIDLLVTLGGGSVTDAGKMVRLCLANGVTAPEQLDPFVTRMVDGRKDVPRKAAPTPEMLCVPTTLSAGDFSAMAGCSDTTRNVKQSFAHPRMMATAVVLDPAATVPTPEWLFLSTGIRAVDHAVEDICSTNANAFAEGASVQALRLLTRGLRGAKADPAALPPRLDCLQGAWLFDGRVAIRRGEGRLPRDRPRARRNRRHAARVHVLRHAAARATLQRFRDGRTAGAGVACDGRTGRSGG